MPPLFGRAPILCWNVDLRCGKSCAVSRSEAFEKKELERIKAANPGFAFVFDLALDGHDHLRFRNTHPLIYRYIQDNFEQLPESPESCVLDLQGKGQRSLNCFPRPPRGARSRQAPIRLIRDGSVRDAHRGDICLSRRGLQWLAFRPKASAHGRSVT